LLYLECQPFDGEMGTSHDRRCSFLSTSYPVSEYSYSYGSCLVECSDAIVALAEAGGQDAFCALSADERSFATCLPTSLLAAHRACDSGVLFTVAGAYDVAGSAFCGGGEACQDAVFDYAEALAATGVLRDELIWTLDANCDADRFLYAAAAAAARRLGSVLLSSGGSS
jgi:hypothetical protein